MLNPAVRQLSHEHWYRNRGGVTSRPTPCVRFGCASAKARGRSIGGQNPNLRTGVIDKRRSVSARTRARPEGQMRCSTPRAKSLGLPGSSRKGPRNSARLRGQMPLPQFRRLPDSVARPPLCLQWRGRRTPGCRHRKGMERRSGPESHTGADAPISLPEKPARSSEG